MGGRVAVRLGWAMLGSLLLAAAAALAQDDAVRIDYSAPEQCVDGAEFLHEALSRSKYGRLANRRQLALRMRVTITVEGEETVGRLEFTDVNSQPVVREVRAATCDELLPGLALVTGLAIDAQVVERHPGAEEDSAPAATASAPAAPGPATGPLPPPPGGEPTPARDTGVPPSQPRDRVEDAGQADAQWTVGAQATTASAVAPGNVYGGSAFAGFSPGQSDWAIRLALLYAAGASVGNGTTEARFDWLALRADFCPLSLKLGPLTGLPCAAAEGGGVHAAGRRSDVIVDPRSEWDAWVALGALARLEAPLGHWLLAELEGGAVFPLIQRTYRYERPYSEVYETPVVGWTASVGLGVRIP